MLVMNAFVDADIALYTSGTDGVELHAWTDGQRMLTIGKDPPLFVQDKIPKAPTDISECR